MTDVNKRVSHALAKRICAKAVMYLILVLACLLVLLPFSIVVSTSLKTYAEHSGSRSPIFLDMSRLKDMRIFWETVLSGTV